MSKPSNEWSNISINQVLSEEFIREFNDKVDWENISRYQTLSEEFIREFKDKVVWHNISFSQTLSEEFIREFKDKVHWYSISANQVLSEEFIREFKDRVDWHQIFKYQELSKDFISEFNLTGSEPITEKGVSSLINMVFNPDWTSEFTPEDAERELKGFKFKGPGWYLTNIDTLLVVPAKFKGAYLFYVWNQSVWGGTVGQSVNGLVNVPTRVDNRTAPYG